MKLAYFQDNRVGAVKGDRVVDLTPLLEDLPHRDRQDLMPALIGAFDRYVDRLREHVEAEEGVPLSTVSLRAPLPRVRQIDCMATNYLENGTLEKAFPINAFHKSPSAVIGPDEAIVLQDIPATVFEAEAELAIVVGRQAKDVSEAEAMDHVFGYMNFIDGSARGLPPSRNVFFQAKSRDTFAPMGPYIVTADEIRDPQNLPVKLWINGELRQDFSTSDMAYSIARCISWLSTIHTLEPGDVVATGTNHRGLSALHDGDLVELETEGLGRLRTPVRDDLKRTWTRDTRLQENEKRVARGEEPAPTGIPATQLTGKYAPA
ncbi:fumarylacetoacetate hydrolase family protein [Roseitranquillus sediminis]|uniref:fumarylacetoacetate hydrolase family protein n=1 Tax=Roseitranquillus sediminis TaxID=2809051 RepID=UPI001D0C72B9|nr:fumarylacetoacetate hydrolase family protein [Roseitranquillus sediminis]MBM9594709.1 fumarylacetoacetate hydrolase family protein [Roseitranquillus sediminis]